MPPPNDLELSYLASFPSGSLDPSVDKTGLGPMMLGHTDAADINAVAEPQSGAYRFGVTNPNATLRETYSGAFLTPVDFGPGTLFSVRATYIGPEGPFPAAGVLWAVGLMVRTGGAVADANEPRAGVTLQVRGGGLRLNMPGAETPLNLPNMPQDRFDAVFDPNDPAPITLELVVNRITGVTDSSVKIGDFPPVLGSCKLKDFKAESGPAITAVGPAIAVAAPPGARAFVQVRDFRLSLPKH